MAKVVEHRMFVCSDADNNNNKFWEYFWHDDGSFIAKYGRVGSTCQVEDPKQMTREQVDAKVASKLKHRPNKPPYKEIKLEVTETGPTGSSKISNVKEAAVRDIAAGNPELEKLVARLAEANRHELQVASGGQLNIDLSTGIVKTPVGVVSSDNVVEARKLLKTFVKVVNEKDFTSPAYKRNLSEYLMYVPQRVAARNFYESFITSKEDLANQERLLDQLEGSISLAKQRLEDAKKAAAGAKPTDKAFEVQLELLDSKDPNFLRLVKFFHEGKNDMHTSRRLKPLRAYSVHIPHMRTNFEQDGAKLTNIWELWHGTRVFNVLSILKSGLLMPKTLSTMQIAGAMFGNGLYFSDQSTKSLNYSYGYWDGGAKDSNCFMFAASVGMGKHYTPSHPTGTLPAGYDSMYAKGGKSGVMNNEMIVYRLGQADLKFLVEFGE